MCINTINQKHKDLGPFDLQNESTGQNSTGQYKAEQHRTNIYDIKQILSCMIFDGKNVILVI
jgi:hypothetical protein